MLVRGWCGCDMVYGDLTYGAASVYGGTDVVASSDHCNLCGEGWRFEVTELHTGVVKAVLHPISAEWEELFSRPGQGNMKVQIVGLSIANAWPRTTGIYISRVMKDGTRRAAFGGYIESCVPDEENWTLLDIGIRPMDQYPFHQPLANEDEGIVYSTPGYNTPEDPGPGKSQTEIAVDFINLATTGRCYIPLTATAQPSTKLRVRHFDAWEYKNLGEAIQQLTEDEDGVMYRMTHHFAEGPARWTTRLDFSDAVDIDRGVELRSDYEAWQYGLEVNGSEQAARIYGVGAGEGVTQMFAVAYDEDAALPEFRKTLAWKDVSVAATLNEHTTGAVAIYRDPVTTPSVTLLGLDDVPPEDLLTGDIVSADIGYGAITFRDEKARVAAIAWRLAVGSQVARAVALNPIIRPALSVKLQTPAKEPVPQTPEQAANPPPETPISVPAPQYPSQVLDLSIWKLTLPTGSSGKPTEIKQPALATYSSEFFHTVDGPGVLFKAPQKGVTTPNSKNTRTELREMKPGGKDNASWSTGTMEAELAFTHLPSSKPHVVGMQIHDKDDDVTVLRLEGTDLWTTNGDNTHGKKIMSGYQLGTRIKVKVVAGGGSIKWYLNGNEVSSLSKKVSGGYFKAGAYQQAGNSGPDYGEVIIYSLVVTH